MQKAHKDLLRTFAAGLRHTLLGRYDGAGAVQAGDLDRELERLDVGRDGSITPLDARSSAAKGVVGKPRRDLRLVQLRGMI